MGGAARPAPGACTAPLAGGGFAELQAVCALGGARAVGAAGGRGMGRSKKWVKGAGARTRSSAPGGTRGSPAARGTRQRGGGQHGPATGRHGHRARSTSGKEAGATGETAQLHMGPTRPLLRRGPRGCAGAARAQARGVPATRRMRRPAKQSRDARRAGEGARSPSLGSLARRRRPARRPRAGRRGRGGARQEKAAPPREQARAGRGGRAGPSHTTAIVRPPLGRSITRRRRRFTPP
jgi:hypothetical protein